MTNSELKNKITAWFDGLTVENEEGKFLTVEVPQEIFLDFCRKLKEEGFDYLFSLTGMDFGKELGVTYHVESTASRQMVQFTVKTADREKPELDSVRDIWPAAHYHEMEAFDFFGIVFRGHPDMRRLFMPEGWKGFPLRKDYVDEVNMLIR